jgi:hypothetical protein
VKTALEMLEMLKTSFGGNAVGRTENGLLDSDMGNFS